MKNRARTELASKKTFVSDLLFLLLLRLRNKLEPSWSRSHQYYGRGREKSLDSKNISSPYQVSDRHTLPSFLHGSLGSRWPLAAIPLSRLQKSIRSFRQQRLGKRIFASVCNVNKNSGDYNMNIIHLNFSAKIQGGLIVSE